MTIKPLSNLFRDILKVRKEFFREICLKVLVLASYPVIYARKYQGG